MGHIVFISHDANRTGAPIVLLHLLRWLKEQHVFSFSIVLLRGGELEAEFRAIAPTYIWEVVPYRILPDSVWRRYWSRITRLVHPQQDVRNENKQKIIASILEKSPQLIYANTVVSAEVAIQLKAAFNCPTICHVHELAMAIEGYFGTTRFGEIIPSLDLLIAASQAVKNNLITTYSIHEHLIAKVYEFIAEPVFSYKTPSEINSIRSSLNIPLDAFLVIGSGTFEWRKSPSLLIQIADYMQRNMDTMPYFLWVGGHKDSLDWQELQYDIERLGLDNYVKFIGSRPNLTDYLQAAEVFVLTSREDPYPLVCLEAAILSKPILCFDKSGGMPEFVGDDCGRVIPFLQTEMMARAIRELAINHEERHKLGHNAYVKVKGQHSVEVAGQQIVNLIENIISKN